MIWVLFTVSLSILNPLDDGTSSVHGCYSVEFETSNTHPPFVPPAGAEFAGDIFQRGVHALPESVLVQTVVAGGGGRWPVQSAAGEAVAVVQGYVRGDCG